MKSLHYFICIAFLYILITEANSSFLHDIASFLGISQDANTNNSTVEIIIKKRDIKQTIKRAASAIESDSNITLEIETSKSSKHEKPPKENQTALPVCDEDHLMVYLAELQAINPESIINLSTVDELGLMCRQVADSLDKMDQFLLTCQIPDEKDLYIQLIKGVDKLYDTLCTENSKIKDHLPCLKDLHDDFETCYGPPDWTEDNNMAEVCRAYKDIADCYYIKAAKVCGLEAGKVMKLVIKAVIDSILTSCICKNILSNPLVKDPAPEHIKSNGNNINMDLITTILALILKLI